MSQINNGLQGNMKQKFYKKRWFKFLAIFLFLSIFGGCVFAWKTGKLLNKISDGGMFQTLVNNIPGVEKKLEGENEGRINVLLLGMRGADLPGGGNLADTIMLFSIKPQENKVSMISIPRDLYVTVPDTSDKQKINYVHFYGEEKGEGRGLEYMKRSVSEVTGLPIHYAASINFTGFKQLIDAIGGIEITLDTAFDEPMQFNEPHVCDSFFNVPTGKYDNKTVTYYSKDTKTYKTRIVKSYPLCSAPKESLECGGEFRLPAGKQTITGEQALCYARSRVTSNDFERAKRQQLVVQLVKDKMLSAGTLTDFNKVNGILEALGNNVRSDMQLWEMQRLYDLYKEVPNVQIYQRVLENTEEGLLYHPEESNGAGYILLPRGDNYDRIHEMAQNIFTLSAQSDIKPK